MPDKNLSTVPPSISGLGGLFLTGMVQVTLVALNTYQVSHKRVFGALVVGFLISIVWTLNVKRIAIGSWLDRVAYASGAMTGTGMGMLLSDLFYN